VIVAKNEKLAFESLQHNSEHIQLLSQQRPHLLPSLNTNLTHRNLGFDVMDSGDMRQSAEQGNEDIQYRKSLVVSWVGPGGN
jgi:hypothetical protein